MSEIDYTNSTLLKSIVQETDSLENKTRKEISKKQFEIFKDRAAHFVKEYLRAAYTTETVNEMPIIGSINLAKRVVSKEAALYIN